MRAFKAGLKLGAAVAALSATPAHAGPLSSLLKTDLAKTVAKTTGAVTATTAQVSTVTLSSVLTVVPLPKPAVDTVTKITNPLLVTVNSAPGSVVNTIGAVGTIADNTTTQGLPYLLKGDVFEAPEPTEIEPKWGKIRSFWGKIRSFQGEEVTPYWGKIRSFWGDLNPFEGDVTRFWGDLRTFNDGTRRNAVAPEWGKIRSFWDELGTSWSALRPAWDKGDYRTSAAQLQAIVARSSTFWGDAVRAQTGKDFNAGFAQALLGKYGIDLADPASLARLDVDAREHFFLEWYDGLMQFSGVDNPDYWMRMVNWSPSLTQVAGEGKDSVIGLLDFTVSDPAAGTIKSYKGASDFDNGHGSAVASLMVAPHDGKGVMGIAPMASVLAYNPFDATETAGWADIKQGLVTLSSRGASIVNMSLGVPGWTLHPDWNSVLSEPGVVLATKDAVLVIAAGNDGIAQPQDIAWTNGAHFIVVGSVAPDETISEFSNRPGEACLQTTTGCDKLKDHFIVAPGEMMLVSDGQGGVARYSGTSFSAPLVSGTVALIHDRWPWLAKYPGETVDIVLRSARDLGAPGTDPVFGRGMLDVTAALSPLDYGRLTWYSMTDAGHAKPMSSASIRSSNAAQIKAWETAGMYFYAFETIGGSYRDFAIPLSSKLVDSRALSAGTSKERFQAYLYNQVIDWIKGGSALASPARFGFTGGSAPMSDFAGLDLSVQLTPRPLTGYGFREGQSRYQLAMNLADKDGRFAFRFGEGGGAAALGNSIAFASQGDYDPASSGANPLVGMASGGAYAQVSYALGPRLSIASGFTRQHTDYELGALPLAERVDYVGLGGYGSAAGVAALTYRPARGIELTGSYTRLSEERAVLGIQGLARDVFGRSSATDGLTLAASLDAAPTLRIGLTATLATTRAGSADTLVSTGSQPLRSTAFQLNLAKDHVFDRRDALRVSLAQPLHLESGSFDVSAVEVIDRQTGELGLVTRRFTLPGEERPLVGEFRYGRALMGGQARLSLFGRAQLRGEPDREDAAVLGGASFSLRY